MELVVLRLAACDAQFWRRLGQHVDPTCMVHPCAKLVLNSVRLYLTETGSHPGSTLVTVQRVHRLHVDGKIKRESVDAVVDALESAADLGAVDAEAVIAVVAPVVRRRLQNAAVLRSMDEYGKRGDFSSIVELLETARGVGQPQQGGDGTDVTAAAMAAFDAEPPDRLATPVAELTVAMGGGLSMRSLGTVMADAGVGKSMFLVSQAAVAAQLGLHVLLVTLELDKLQQLARLCANLTGYETNLITSDPAVRAKAVAALAATEHQRGPVHIEVMDPGVTVEDVLPVLEEQERRRGRKVDLLVVDYADKLGARLPRGSRDGLYEVGRVVWEGLRDKVARPRGMWVWTACQPVRRDEREMKRRLDFQHAAESAHKYRISDVFLTLNPLSMDNFEEYEIWVAKNRGDRSRYSVGPVMGDHALGRAVTL